MKKVVYIYAKMLAVAAMVFPAILCLAACAEEQSEPVIEIPMLTPGPTPTFVPEPAETGNDAVLPLQNPVPSEEPITGIQPSGTPDISGEKLIALTFDDGPYGEVTNRILDVVEAYRDQNVHVTFFALGSQVDKFPKTVLRAKELGCEIANHTYDHKNLTKIPTQEMISQVEDAADLVEQITGERPKLVRPPYGAKNDDVYAAVKYPLILWNIDTLDWKTKDTDSTVAAALGAGDGDIVLMHDLRHETAAAVEKIVPQLLEQGYKLVTVSEMFEAKGIELTMGKSYRKAK